VTESVSQPTVLVVDDEKNIRLSIQIALRPEGVQVVLAHDAAAALRVMRERVVDVLILDIKLGEVNGLALYRSMQAEGLNVPTVFISGHATLTEAAEAVKSGAFDFLEKPFGADKIAVTVRRCLEFHATQERLRLIESRQGGTNIIGESAAVKTLVAAALKVAETSATVLICGESGTGKELIANAIHDNSPRGRGPFVRVNCSAIPESLIESELFGHLQGSFTGAVANKRGLFEVANRGTLFLDEVADLSLHAQAKVLRVLQSGELQKIGAEKATQVDVRVISATHKDLQSEVSAGRFRQDLYYRLNVVPIRVPSLRERAEDIELLARFFAKRVFERHNIREKPIDEEVLAALRRHQWPGNIRELQNIMERLVIMSGPRITLADLPAEIVGPTRPTSERTRAGLREFRDRAEREFIISTLKKNGGNITQSALDLGVGRSYLHRRLAVLGVEKKHWLL
jgi:two-component system nitrogen regulation response regulator NtrX